MIKEKMKVKNEKENKRKKNDEGINQLPLVVKTFLKGVPIFIRIKCLYH